ncbi:MAG: TIM barrel protein [Candidatus Omnitrophota bacterium]
MIKIGTAGTGGLGYRGCLRQLPKFGIKALEVEFTYGVKMTAEQAREVAQLARVNDISLSIHAPFFINLASLEPEKVTASRKRIIASCAKADILGASHVVFHAGFYQQRDPEEIYQIIKKEILDLLKTLKKHAWKTALALETTGKVTQFGSLDELLRMRQETGCDICVDFAHLLARDGKIDYDQVFKKIKKLKHIHAHFSGIEFSAKGERKHLLTQEKDIHELAKHIIKNKVDITIINESPQPLKDAAKMVKIFSKVAKK